MTNSTLSETKHFEFLPLTPLEESFEDEDSNSLPIQSTTVQHNTIDNSIITSSIPSLSIVSDDHSTMLSTDHHTLSSRDTTNKINVGTVRTANQYRRPLPVVSLVDPILHNKFSRYLNGSFDSTVGYTTTDVTSDVDSVDHPHPSLKMHKVTHGRVDSGTQVPEKRIQSLTHKGTQSMTYRGTQSKSTELDNLWKEYLVSPLHTDWVARSTDAKTEMCYCEELKQLEYTARHCTKLPVKPQVTAYPTHTDSSNNSHSTLYTDTAVQTSPSLLTATLSSDTSDVPLTNCPCISSHVIKGSSPTSNSSSSDQESSDLIGSCEQPASLTKLSLQEACRLFKKDFISNCHHRQRMIHRTRKQREEELVINKHQTALANLARDYKMHHQNSNNTPVKAAGMTTGKTTHPKITARQMHEQTKRRWKMLPEVKQRQEEMKKKATAAINRMNMKLYQQRVLHNMRKKL